MMKKELKAITYGVLVFTAIYLIGAFALADFNVSNWPEAGRAFVGILAGGIGLVITFASYNLMTEK